MGWQGDFNIRYEGKNIQDFLNLAKMLIPNSLMRFDFSNCNLTANSIELKSTRQLSWYTTEVDMVRLVSYLPAGDTVSIEIKSGREKEVLTIRKSNERVILEHSSEDSERYVNDYLGIPEMLFSEHSPLYYHEPEEINICSMDGYVQLIANTFAGNERLIPAVCNFMYEVLDLRTQKNQNTKKSERNDIER